MVELYIQLSATEKGHKNRIVVTTELEIGADAGDVIRNVAMMVRDMLIKDHRVHTVNMSRQGIG